MMMTAQKAWIGALLLAALALTACSGGNALNGRKTSPDAFEVVVRPPLTLPPNFAVRPNADGDDIAPPPNASPLSVIEAVEQAEQVLGTTPTQTASDFDALFGTHRIIPNIRRLIDEETLGLQLDSRIPIQELFGGAPEIGPDLDAGREAYRIRRAIIDGKPLTDTPSVGFDPISRESISLE